MKRIMAVVILAGTTLGAMLTIASPVSAALPTCYRTAQLWTGAYGPTDVPSAGTTAESTSCVMGRGATSAAVKRLQTTLNKCYGENLVVDGIFGSLTEAALKRAQTKAGTTADGVYGPYTRDRLRWWLGSTVCALVDGPGGY